jgi:adenylate cyclase
MRHRPWAIGIGVGLLVGVLTLTVRGMGWLQPLDLHLYDLLVQWDVKQAPVDTRLTIISINEDDIHRQGRWPISDAMLAEMVVSLKSHGARAIGIDIYRDIEVPPGRAELDEVLKTSSNVIVVTKLGGTGIPTIQAPPVLAGTEQVSFNDVLVDPDGVVRRGLLFLDEGDQVAFGFALRVALLYLEREGIRPQPDADDPQRLRLGAVTLIPFESGDGGYVGADASGYQVLLDYRGGLGGFRTFSLTQLLAGQVPSDAIQDKIILIGVSAESVLDWFPTPLSSAGSPGEFLTGVTLHGHLVSQLLRAGLQGHQGKRSWSEQAEGWTVLLTALFGGMIGMTIRSPWRYGAWIAGGVLTLLAGTGVLYDLGWWVPAAPPVLAWLSSTSLATASVLKLEQNERTMLMRLFEQHVSPQVADSIWKERKQFLQGGRPRPQKMMVTVLFSDFKGYTAAAEQLDPRDLLEWINSYIEAMAHLITVHGGVVDDYAGDGIKANFGVPILEQTQEAVARQALAAVRCALKMRDELQRLNSEWYARGRDPVGMRIGICTGFVVAGTIGSAQRLKYTTVGDTVNVAARLESLDRDNVPIGTPANPCRILIDSVTRSRVEADVQIESVGYVTVKGRQEPVEAYRVIGLSHLANGDGERHTSGDA